MIRVTFLIFSLFFVQETNARNLTDREAERETLQKQYDQACEEAREKKLKPMRQEGIKECIAKEKKKEYCEKFYSTLGNATYSRPPMFYYLPECKKALKYKRSYRQ